MQESTPFRSNTCVYQVHTTYKYDKQYMSVVCNLINWGAAPFWYYVYHFIIYKPHQQRVLTGY